MVRRDTKRRKQDQRPHTRRSNKGKVFSAGRGRNSFKNKSNNKEKIEISAKTIYKKIREAKTIPQVIKLQNTYYMTNAQNWAANDKRLKLLSKKEQDRLMGRCID